MGRIIFVIIIAVLAVGGFYLSSRMDTLVADGVETYGPAVMHVDVGLDSVSVNPFSGIASLSGFALGQPEGYGTGDMAALENFEVKLEPMSLFSNHIKIDSLKIEAPTIDARLLGGKSNFDALMEGLDLPPADDNAPASDIVMTVKSIEVISPEIRVSAKDGLIEGDKAVSLASFTLTNLGTDEEGMAPREIIRHVMDTMRPQIARAMAEIGIEQFAGEEVDALREKAKGELKGLESEAREKGLGGAIDAFKSAVKKRKDDN